MTKSKKSSNTFEVEYKIVPTCNYFTKVTYCDQTGKSVVLKDLKTFRSGTKKVTVSKRPFAARISTEINNTTTAPINYLLCVLVNGKVKKSVSGMAPPLTSLTVTTVEYTVN
jgi:hypothetical protein